MLEIGLVGLDTSHAATFASFLSDQPGVDLAAVWDGGTIQSAADRGAFCDRFDATPYDDFERMVPAVDAALVLSVDWNAHVGQAVPFLEASVPTLVDKPIAGRLEDVERLESASRSGGQLFGGSAIPFHPDLADRIGVGGSTYAVGHNDPFYYGTHIVDTVRAIAGSDWEVVSPLNDPGMTVGITFADDSQATVRLDGSPRTSEFGILNVSDEMFTVNVITDEQKRETMYAAYLGQFLDIARGGATDRDRVLDSVRLLLAVHAALETERPITPTCRSIREYEVASAPFVAEYAENWA
jgi:hypothetical protein